MSFLRLGTKLTTTPLYFLTVLREKVQHSTLQTKTNQQ